VTFDPCPIKVKTCRSDKSYSQTGARSGLPLTKQEAQLPQRDSASATHVFLGSLTDRALH